MSSCLFIIRETHTHPVEISKKVTNLFFIIISFFYIYIVSLRCVRIRKRGLDKEIKLNQSNKSKNTHKISLQVFLRY